MGSKLFLGSLRVEDDELGTAATRSSLDFCSGGCQHSKNKIPLKGIVKPLNKSPNLQLNCTPSFLIVAYREEAPLDISNTGVESSRTHSYLQN
jgi:hypothetical protein